MKLHKVNNRRNERLFKRLTEGFGPAGISNLADYEQRQDHDEDDSIDNTEMMENESIDEMIEQQP
tara:strand:- start:15129 stop:15323 length:195 start_codon:yes stop_codon:yes gene_type:complete